jgi:hypothetical protein
MNLRRRELEKLSDLTHRFARYATSLFLRDV